MLLFDLVNNDIFAPRFPKLIIQNSCRYFHEQKHVQKYKDNEIYVVWLVVLNSEVLVVRVVVVGG